METYIVTFYNTDTTAWWESEYYTSSQDQAQAIAESECGDCVVISDICTKECVDAASDFRRPQVDVDKDNAISFHLYLVRNLGWGGSFSDFYDSWLKQVQQGDIIVECWESK